jgi:micrococcal nuclease
MLQIILHDIIIKFMYTYEAKITKVTDGDTVHADINLGFGVILRDTILRLYGINAPEMKGESASLGKASKDRLESLVLGKTVTLKTFKDKREKYGRLLAQIWLEGSSINDALVTEGFAKTYIL